MVDILQLFFFYLDIACMMVWSIGGGVDHICMRDA